jgi:thiol-disulfide isomerase/thioredoxin
MDIYEKKYKMYKMKYFNLKYKLKGGNAFNSSDSESETGSYPKLMLFKSEQCIHCINFKSDWDKLQKELPNEFKNLKIKTYDSFKHQNKFMKYKIDSYPTLLLINNDKVIEFNEHRTFDNIKKFISKNI